MKNKTTPAKARRLEELASTKKGLFAINPLIITPEPGFNGRTDYGDLKTLASDIEANGLLQPLKIRKITGTETIHLIDGHRRHAAITTILIPAGRWPADPKSPKLPAPVDCTAMENGTGEIDRLFMQLSMNTGKPLTFLEEATLYQRILAADTTLKPADIARRAAKTKQAISDSLRLVNDGSPHLLSEVSKGKLAATTAITIIKQAGEDHTAQDQLLEAAAQAAGESHITPKHIPAPEDQDQPESETPDPRPSASAMPSGCIRGSSSPQPEQTEPESPTDHRSPSTDHPPAKPKFTLYKITDAPADPLENGSYHETDRLTLSNPPEGILLLHLLGAPTPEGFAYGFRIHINGSPEGITSLPHPDGAAGDLHPEEGFRMAIDTALETAALILNEYDDEALYNSLFTAFCKYFPEQGEPEEPESLPFTPETSATAPEPTGYQAILAAPSTNRDGSAPGKGQGGFSPPDKQLLKLDKILDDLEAKDTGDEARITTTELVLNFIRNEASSITLRQHLQGK